MSVCWIGEGWEGSNDVDDVSQRQRRMMRRAVGTLQRMLYREDIGAVDVLTGRSLLEQGS
jgi:hypothetical protein